MTNAGNRPDLEDGFPAGIDHIDALLDEALRETFPASDPVAISAERGPRPAAGHRVLRSGSAGGVTIAGDKSVIQAAKLLGAGTDLVVVCAPGDVIAKTDVVAWIGDCQDEDVLARRRRRC